ncbi:MAG: hypothetical protein IK115_09980 [Lachnospiraceae bacterium]|nr:hypothetical protein [Lachnospiraceae bacterium]
MSRTETNLQKTRQEQKQAVSSATVLKVQEKLGKLLGHDSAQAAKYRDRVSEARSNLTFVKGLSPARADMQIRNSQQLLGRKWNLSKSQLGKRAKKMKENLSLQEQLLKENEAYETARETGLTEAAAKKIEKTGSGSALLTKADADSEYGELLRDWGAYATLYGEEDKATSLLGRMQSKETERLNIDIVLKEAQDADLSEFAYKNDEEFIKDYHRKYARLKALTHAQAISEDMEKTDGYIPDMGGVNAVKLKAKLKLLVGIREDYERRMSMISSEYYSLLAGTDVSEIKEEDIPGIVSRSGKGGSLDRYLQDAKALKSSRYGKGADLKALEKEALEEEKKKEYVDSMKQAEELSDCYKEYLESEKLSPRTLKQQSTAMLAALKKKYGETNTVTLLSRLSATLFNKDLKKENKAYTKANLSYLLNLQKIMDQCQDLLNEEINKRYGDIVAEQTRKQLDGQDKKPTLEEVAREAEQEERARMERIVKLDDEIRRIRGLEGDALGAEWEKICSMAPELEKLLEGIGGDNREVLSAYNDKRYEYLKADYKQYAEAAAPDIKLLEGLRLKSRAEKIRMEVENGADFFSLLSKEELARVTETYPGLEGKEIAKRYASTLKRSASVAIKKSEKEREEMLLNKDNAMIKNIGSINERKKKYPDLLPGAMKDVHKGAEYHEKARKLLDEKKKEWAKANGKQPYQCSEVQLIKNLYKEAQQAGDDETMFILSCYKRFKMEHYRLAGSTQRLITEPLFRSFASTEMMSSIREMKEEDYNNMLRDLSAGAFLERDKAENAKEKEARWKEVNAARKQNKKGLRTYYDTVRRHYEQMEKKYGYELGDPSWLMLHWNELVKDFANTQVDNNLVDHDREVLEVTATQKPGDPQDTITDGDDQDVRLVHLIRFYNYYNGACQMIYSFFQKRLYGEGGTPEENAESVRKFMEMAAVEKAYLQSHPQEDVKKAAASGKAGE